MTLQPIAINLLAYFSPLFYNFCMSVSFHLFQLQKIDSQIDSNQKKIKAIDEFISSDQTVVNSEKVYFEIQQQCLSLKNEIQDFELEISRKRIKIEQSESSLYGGKVTNSKELISLQDEIRSHKTHIGEIEEAILQKMSDLEKCDEMLKQADKDLKNAKAISISRLADKKGEQQKLQSDIKHLQVERAVISQQIDPNILQTYEDIRKKKNGIAVSNAVDQTCGSCGSEITPAEWQIARTSAQILLCRTCGRILYTQ
jgi:predicted  nucleic acid-binding Zn-ribbon protein